MNTILLAQRLRLALQFEEGGQTLQAELTYLDILTMQPAHPVAAERLGRLAAQRGDPGRAAHFFDIACRASPGNASLGVDLALALASAGRREEARAQLEGLLARLPDTPVGWLLLGRLREADGDKPGALKAWNGAMTRARRAGMWHDEGSTPPDLLGLVLHAIEQLRTGRRELFFGCYDELRQRFGGESLRRLDRALSGYLGDWDATPADPRQRPIFFYFPGLADEPYLDPFLQPWARRLESAFTEIRAEAQQVLEQDRKFERFLDLPAHAKADDYVAGDGPAPAWDAFFFYRHGRRYDDNHRRCPTTSSVLESIELCRIADQAPEICFSVLAPGTHLLPHHGVTNVRQVMHLPLVVPPDCALNLVGVGEHRWREGQLVMFDDTFRHEAWNRSSSHRMILLMDCWHPHLTEVEKLGLTSLIETINGLQVADEGVAVDA